jgi:hypothetical protein
MASTDRALRFLARERPDVVAGLVRELLPGVLRDETTLEPDAVDDPKLDLPPPLDADLVARVGDDEVLHVEFQGYRDRTFVDRLFRYHLSLVLRNPQRRVSTVAIWLLRPPDSQRIELIRRGSTIVEVASVVLSEVKASRLLASAGTACFAPVADAEGWTEQELCGLVAQALKEQGAGFSMRYTAVALAAARGRYDAMIRAMTEMDPPLIIEDLVLFGEDRGYARGLNEGLERGLNEGLERGLNEGLERGLNEGRAIGLDEGGRAELRRAIVDLLETRGIALSAIELSRIEAEQELPRLRSWLRLAAIARSALEVFS